MRSTILWLSVAGCMGPDGAPLDSGDVGPISPDDDVADTDSGVDTAAVDPEADEPDGPCGGLDETVDLDANGVSDCLETLVPNPQLRKSVEGYIHQNTTSNLSSFAWSPDDAEGHPGGSIAVVNESPGTWANAAGVWSACVPATPGVPYAIWYRYRVPVEVSDRLLLITSFDVYRDAACAEPAASVTPGPPPLEFGGWRTLAVPAPITLDADWHSFRLRVELYKPDVTAPVAYALDDFLVRPL